MVFAADLLGPDSQVEVESCLQQQILHIIRVDGEVEIQRVPQQLVRLLTAFSVQREKHSESEAGHTAGKIESINMAFLGEGFTYTIW